MTEQPEQWRPRVARNDDTGEWWIEPYPDAHGAEWLKLAGEPHPSMPRLIPEWVPKVGDWFRWKDAGRDEPQRISDIANQQVAPAALRLLDRAYLWRSGRRYRRPSWRWYALSMAKWPTMTVALLRERANPGPWNDPEQEMVPDMTDPEAENKIAGALHGIASTDDYHLPLSKRYAIANAITRPGGIDLGDGTRIMRVEQPSLISTLEDVNGERLFPYAWYRDDTGEYFGCADQPPGDPSDPSPDWCAPLYWEVRP